MAMNSLSMMEARLPPGFRFHPRDEELVCDYLAKKLSGNNGSNPSHSSSYGFPFIVDVDLNKCEPWELPEMACVGGQEWYFYSLRDRKYATGQRTNRATQSGYWKATGKDRQVRRKGVLVGMRKTLVFYEGRAPKGKKTNWIMHEFRAEELNDGQNFLYKEDWVLCRILYKCKSAPSKTKDEKSCDDDMGSLSLPSLNANYITFEQSARERYEQVPCFSNLSQNSFPQCTNAAGSHAPMVECNFPVKTAANMRTIADFGPCDSNILKAVLNHFKFEPNMKNELLPIPSTTQGSLETYLSGNGFPCIWTSM